jgi:hypothetical protein
MNVPSRLSMCHDVARALRDRLRDLAPRLRDLTGGE